MIFVFDLRRFSLQEIFSANTIFIVPIGILVIIMMILLFALMIIYFDILTRICLVHAILAAFRATEEILL